MLPEQMSRVELPASFFRKVPARKAMQIESFARRLSLPPSQLLEWCAGKAHLGRLLARLYGHEMTGVELREELCEVGNELACVHHLPVRLHAQDVMAEGVARWLVGMDGVIGLRGAAPREDAALGEAGVQGVQELALFLDLRRRDGLVRAGLVWRSPERSSECERGRERMCRCACVCVRERERVSE